MARKARGSSSLLKGFQPQRPELFDQARHRTVPYVPVLSRLGLAPTKRSQTCMWLS